MDNLVKIFFELGDDTWHHIPTESVWAETTSEDSSAFIIRNTPFLIKGISFLDTVRAHPDKEMDDTLRFNSVIERSGHSTYRIIIEHECRKFKSYWKKLEKLGYTYESSTYNTSEGEKTLYAIDVPASSNVYKADSVLERGEKNRIWIFEEGHCGHPLNK